MKLQEMRKAANMSQAEAADRLGINASLLSRYETGASVAKASLIASMAGLYECTSDELLDIDFRPKGEAPIERDGETFVLKRVSKNAGVIVAALVPLDTTSRSVADIVEALRLRPSHICDIAVGLAFEIERSIERAIRPTSKSPPG